MCQLVTNNNETLTLGDFIIKLYLNGSHNCQKTPFDTTNHYANPQITCYWFLQPGNKKVQILPLKPIAFTKFCNNLSR